MFQKFQKLELVQYSNLRKVGALNHVIITTSKVMQPPNTTDGTFPNMCAASPLSNCPSSLLELINMLFTLNTRPRILSGVFNWVIVPLTTTLTPSSMPLIINAKNEIK